VFSAGGVLSLVR